MRDIVESVCCIYKRRASSLPSNMNKAMREASERRTVTDTDSYAFFVPTIIANERKTEAYIKVMKCHFIWLFACLCMITGCTSGKLSVNYVSYQSLRTDFAQPEKIANDAKIAVEYFFNSSGKMQPVVYNLTSDILIIDQTKSFVIKPDGSSVSYYDPTVRTSTTGTYSSETSGNSFNLGGITAALGIGGPLGALASATSVGSSHTDGTIRQNTISISDQPYVHIGPKGCIAMSKAYTIAGIGSSSQSRGNIIDVSDRDSNVKFSVCITYSLDDGNTYNKLVTHFYESSNITIPVNNKKVSTAFYEIYKLKPDALAENMYLFKMPNNIKVVTRDVMGDFLTHYNIYDTYIQGSLIDFQ